MAQTHLTGREKIFTQHTFVVLDETSQDYKTLRKQLKSEGPFRICAVRNMPATNGALAVKGKLLAPTVQFLDLEVEGGVKPVEGRHFRRY